MSRGLGAGQVRRAACLSAGRAVGSAGAVALALAAWILWEAAARAAEATPGGGNIVLGWEAEPRTYDSRFAVDANSQYLEGLINCALVDFDKDGKTIGNLAKSWHWASPTTLAVELKGAAKFADGLPVTAADVVATYAFFKNDKVVGLSPRRGAFAPLKSVTAKGPLNVEFELVAADSTFVTNLVVGILPERFAAKEMLTEKDQLVGCGPFRLQGVTANGIELVANPAFSLGVAPKAAGVTIKVVKDENTRYAKLSAGELDIVQNLVNRDKLTAITTQSPKLQVIKRSGLNTTYLGFNMRDKLVGSADVRRAIAYAIDKAKIIKYVLSGMATPADTLLPAADPFHAANLVVPNYDPEKAKALLDHAGFKVGADGKTRFQLSYKTTTDLTRVAVAKAVAADLRRVGIDVTVETLEWGKFKADVEHGQVQMWSLSWIGFKDPDIYRFAFASENFPPVGGNRGWYSNPELDQLVTQAKAETDMAKRVAAYGRVEQIVANDQPYVFLWHEDVFAVVNRAVSGFELYADGRLSSLVGTTKK